MRARAWWISVGLLAAACGGERVEAGSEERCLLEDPGSDPMGLAAPGSGQTYAIWPKGRVPYVLDSSLDPVSSANALTAMNNWQTKTAQVVRFEPAKASDSPRLVVVGGAAPVTNHVGYRSTNSKITLAKSSTVSLIRHELGHVLGLHHEHRHPERDKYIKVQMQNVKNTQYCLNQFKACTNCLPVLDYNVGSVMQYDTNDLSSCRTGPVLLHLDGSPISHVWVLTDGDIATIHAMYGAPATGTGGGGGAAGATGTGGSGANPATGGSAGAAGSGGAAAAGGTAGGALGGAAGVDDVIDVPDEPASGAPDSGDDGGCTVRPSDSAPGAWLVALALALGAFGRRRGARRGGGEGVPRQELPRVVDARRVRRRAHAVDGRAH